MKVPEAASVWTLNLGSLFKPKKNILGNGTLSTMHQTLLRCTVQVSIRNLAIYCVDQFSAGRKSCIHIETRRPAYLDSFIAEQMWAIMLKRQQNTFCASQCIPIRIYGEYTSGLPDGALFCTTSECHLKQTLRATHSSHCIEKRASFYNISYFFHVSISFLRKTTCHRQWGFSLSTSLGIERLQIMQATVSSWRVANERKYRCCPANPLKY